MQLPPIVIVAFAVIVIIMLALDLGIFNKRSHVITNKEATIWSLVWIGLSMVFSVFIWTMTKTEYGLEKFTQFQTAYWIEKALSVDNLFVFIVVFKFFNVPRENHHTVLFWGILGAIVMRAIFIFTGIGIVRLTYTPEFSFMGKSISVNIVLTIFGLFLVYAGIKSWFSEDDDEGEENDFSKSPGAKFVHKFFKVSKEFDGSKFFTMENGIKIATPLLVVVGVIEFTDLLFAVDSIPAIFAIAPDDPFILYTSNIFAILGLRSLYFLLANSIHMFSRLKYGIAVILSFIGIKMIISPIYHIQSDVSLIIVGGLLLVSILLSILFPIKPQAEASE